MENEKSASQGEPDGGKPAGKPPLGSFGALFGALGKALDGFDVQEAAAAAKSAGQAFKKGLEEGLGKVESEIESGGQAFGAAAREAMREAERQAEAIKRAARPMIDVAAAQVAEGAKAIEEMLRDAGSKLGEKVAAKRAGADGVQAAPKDAPPAP